jgi:hypothetical protein
MDNPYSEDNSVLEPEDEITEQEVIHVSRSANKSQIYILLPVKGDHPDLITIDLDSNSYTIEGYD